MGFALGVIATLAYFAYVEHTYPARVVGLLTPPSDQGNKSSEATPLATPRAYEYLKCRVDHREHVPDYLDEVHRFYGAFCKALEKAQISSECPGALQESESFALTFAVDYELSLSPDDRFRFSLQTTEAAKFLPELPEVCSEEWINERIS